MEPTRVRKLLDLAKKIIEDPKDWCQHAPVKSIDGHVSRCSYTALCTAQSDGMFSEEEYEEASFALFREAKALGFDGVAKLNDQATHHAVMEMFSGAHRWVK